MTQAFKITDRHHGRDITAVILVDTNISDYDKLLIESCKDDRGKDVYVSEELKEQLYVVFMQEYEQEYSQMLLDAETPQYETN